MIEMIDAILHWWPCPARFSVYNCITRIAQRQHSCNRFLQSSTWYWKLHTPHASHKSILRLQALCATVLISRTSLLQTSDLFSMSKDRITLWCYIWYVIMSLTATFNHYIQSNQAHCLWSREGLVTVSWCQEWHVILD